MDINEWLATGHEQGWCSEVVCLLHDGTPGLTDEDFDNDDCVYGLRIYAPEER